MPAKLKTCPFCGGEAKKVITASKDDESKIMCTNCFVQTSCDYEDAPVEMWNKRAEQGEEKILQSALPTNTQSMPFSSFEEIEKEFVESVAKSSYNYSLYEFGAKEMFSFIVAKLENSTRS